MVIWTAKGIYYRTEYRSESDLESTIKQVQPILFGRDRIYVDVKKRIGKMPGTINIPDGYLIDLSAEQPRLYVVEIELASHDHLRHIAVQIMQFSLSFESEPHKVKAIVLDALRADDQALRCCQEYATQHAYRNLDHMLESMVYEGAFAALVIIDRMPEELENVLLRKFQFGVEVLELARYEDETGECIYHFEPFLADMTPTAMPGLETSKEGKPMLDGRKIDTIVVPAHEDGFQETFVGENRWYAVRIHGSMRPQIKYIAVYRVTPVSAITHIAPVKSIKPWEDTGKYVINFAAPPTEIGPIRLGPHGKGKGLMGPRYTNKEKLEHAETLDDVW